MNPPSEQQPLRLSKPMIVIGLGILLLAAFDSSQPSIESTRFAFGSDVKPSIGRLSGPRTEFPALGLAIVPQGDFRFFRVDGIGGGPNATLAFSNVSAGLIGRIQRFDPLREDSSGPSSTDAAVLWDTPQMDRGSGVKIHVGRCLIGQHRFRVTVHELLPGTASPAGESRVLADLIDSFEPL
ncbi:MAG: hypothetical protein AAFX06_00185 [Planctomycetota bacterium]